MTTLSISILTDLYSSVVAAILGLVFSLLAAFLLPKGQKSKREPRIIQVDHNNNNNSVVPDWNGDIKPQVVDDRKAKPRKNNNVIKHYTYRILGVVCIVGSTLFMFFFPNIDDNIKTKLQAVCIPLGIYFLNRANKFETQGTED